MDETSSSNGSAMPSPVPETQMHLVAVDLEETSNVPVKKKGTRIQWSKEEDLTLAAAVKTISKSPTAGNSKKNNDYWKRIAEYYNTHRPSNSVPRAVAKLTPRWQTRVAPAVRSFNAIVNRLQTESRNWPSENFLMNNARVIYRLETDSNFTYHHVWDVMKTSASFFAQPDVLHTNKKSRTSESDNGYSNTSVDVEGDMVHMEPVNNCTCLIGQKAAKKKEKSKEKTGKKSDEDGMYKSPMQETFEKYTQLKEMELKLKCEKEERKKEEQIMKYIDFATKDTTHYLPEAFALHQQALVKVKARLKDAGYQV